MARYIVFLATLDDELSTELTIKRRVLSRDAFGRTVDNKVCAAGHVLQRTGAGFAGRGIDGHAAIARDGDAPIAGYVANASQHHVGLLCDRVGDTFADHAIAVDSHLNRHACPQAPRRRRCCFR